jgi:diguanylate cyclase (GGDEF)-like protein
MSDPAVADDVLVFRSGPDGFRLIGGRGRGAGWAGIVDVDPRESESLHRAWRSGVPVRVSSETKVNICGPYWATQAVVVPVGQEHLVVFGGLGVEASPDAVFVTEAARVVSETGDISAEKLLSDELEVVHAVRAMMAFRPVNVRDTARHIATVAARALSCDVAAVRVRTPIEATIDVLQLEAGESVEDGCRAGRDAEPFLEAASSAGNPIIEQTAGADPEVWTERVVSRMTLPIGAQMGLGALSLGHVEGRERGFTSLCQRIGRALAESAEPLLTQAIAHELLTTEREQYQRATLTDPLTGLGNRAAWERTKTSPPTLLINSPRRPLPLTYAILSADVDGLKSINDRDGHAAGDAVLKAAADVLRFGLRPTDVLCRIGGDEFVAVLPNVDARGAKRIVGRISDTLETWQPSDGVAPPRMSVGWAICDGDWEAAMRLADKRMYQDKQKRQAARRHGTRSRTRTRGQAA